MTFKVPSHSDTFMVSMIPHLPLPWQRLQRAAMCPSVPGISLVSRVAFTSPLLLLVLLVFVEYCKAPAGKGE